MERMMSTLFCIKDPTPLVLIGGLSGVGKTSIIDFLLEHFGQFFSQPKSYTSRKKRNSSERYHFSNKSSIIKMYDNGELLNLDSVFGEYYAIAKDSVIEIVKSGKIPIKEVHPNNFYKFVEQGIDTITILVVDSDKNKSSVKIERKGRPTSEDWDIEQIDMVVNISGLSIKESANHVIDKIIAHQLHLGRYPHPKNIDSINESGYSELATEFNDSKRVTTKNFHDISLPFWRSVFKKISEHKYILELGVGNGWLLSNHDNINSYIYGLDISKCMSAEYIDFKITSSARAIPIKSNHIDLAVSSLADPFLYPESLVEVFRVLKPGAVFAFTYPSRVWANNLQSRIEKNKTTFVTQSGKDISVFSICDGINYISDFLYNVGFKINVLKELYLPNDYTSEVSKAITDSANNANVDIQNMPIMMACILKKIP